MSYPYPTRILRDAPVIYLPLNDAPGATTAADASGHSNTGTPTNVTFGSTGVLNADPQSAATLVGTGGVAVAKSATTVLPSTSGSLEVTVRYFTAPAAGTRFVEHGQGGYFWVGVGEAGLPSAGNLVALLYDGVANQIADTGVAADAVRGRLVHLVAVYDSSHLYVYLNGELKATVSAAGLHYPDAAAVTTVGVATDNVGRYTGRIANAAVYPASLPAAAVAAHYAAASTVLRLPRQIPWAGNTDLARRYRDGGAMRLLAVGDSITVNLQGALQRSLKPGKWTGFIGTCAVSTSQVNLGVGIETYPNSAGATASDDSTLTFTANGAAAPDGAAVGDNNCLFARTNLANPAAWAQQLHAGDFIWEALARNVSPVVEALVKKTGTGDDGSYYFALDVDNAQAARAPATGFLACSGSGYAKVSVSLPLDLPVVPAAATLVGFRLPNATAGVTGKTISVGQHFHLTTGETGFEFGSLAVGGTSCNGWSQADGVMPDAYLQALATNYGVTDFMIFLGQNDAAGTFQADLLNLIARLRAFVPGCGIVIVSTYETGDGFGVGTIAGFDAVCRAVATSDGNALYLDLYRAFGPRQLNYANTGGRGDFYDNYGLGDGVHPDDTGRVRAVELIDGLLQLAAYAGDPALLDGLATSTGLASTYATQFDVEDLFGRATVARWSQLDSSQTTADPARVRRALDYAAAELDSFFRGGPYAVPLVCGGGKPVVRRWAATLAGLWLQSGGVPLTTAALPPVPAQLLADTRAEMNDCKSGILQLDAATAGVPGPTAPTISR